MEMIIKGLHFFSKKENEKLSSKKKSPIFETETLFIYSCKKPLTQNFKEFSISINNKITCFFWLTGSSKKINECELIINSLLIFIDPEKKIAEKCVDDSLIFLYLLFNRIPQKNYSLVYNIVIETLTKILINSKNQFKTIFEKQTWEMFFGWLHEIEPSVLYAFFLSRYWNYILLGDDLCGRIDTSNIEMPAIYFNPYFLKKKHKLEHTIIYFYEKNIQLIFGKKLDHRIIAISLFPFYTIQKSKISKIDDVILIIKKRLSQSSHVSKFVLDCFKQRCLSIFNFGEKKAKFTQLFTLNCYKNPLAVQSLNTTSPINDTYACIDPENDEQFLYFGLPSKIILLTSQDYYNFANKQASMNYPLLFIENAQLSYQVRDLMNRYMLKSDSRDNLKYIINNGNPYKYFLDHEKSKLFRLLLDKYSIPQIRIPLQDEDELYKFYIFRAFQSIYNIITSHKLYKSPLCMNNFVKSLNEYNNNNSNKKISLSEDKLNVTQSADIITKKRNKKRVSETFNKTTNNISNNALAIPTRSAKIPSRISSRKNNIMFIDKPSSPYLFIDSVSNFINQEYTQFNEAFSLHAWKDNSYFNIKYIREKIEIDKKKVKNNSNSNSNFSDNNYDEETLNKLYTDNILKIALYAILEKNVKQLFKIYSFVLKFLPLNHILFLYICYQIEVSKGTEENEIVSTLSKVLLYIQKLPDNMIEILSNLYFYNSKIQSIPIEKERKDLESKFNPPPHLNILLAEFKQVFE